MTKYNRIYVEQAGRVYPGAIEDESPYLLTKVLSRFEMYVMPTDKSVAPHLITDGFWEAWITCWVLNNVGPTTNFFDIGANTGYYTFLAHNLGAFVHAFEPQPAYYDMMQATKNRLGLSHPNQIVLHPVALSNTFGTATLHVPKDMHGSASLNHIDAKWNLTDITVEQRRMDEIFHSLDSGSEVVVKMDAEGEEERIWEGSRGLFYNCNGPVTIILEYTPGAYSHHFLDELEKFGDLGIINFAGEEEPVTKQWVRDQGDWCTLVIRRRNNV